MITWDIENIDDLIWVNGHIGNIESFNIIVCTLIYTQVETFSLRRQIYSSTESRTCMVPHTDTAKGPFKNQRTRLKH